MSIGRLNITTSLMTLSSFGVIPRAVHLECAKRIVSYLAKMRHVKLKFFTGTPDYSDISGTRYEWERSVYGNVSEMVPHDAPKALGKAVVKTHDIDSNIYQNMLTGHAITGILHFINQTHLD